MTPQPICNIVKILYEFCVEEFTSAEEGSDKEMAFMKMLDLFPQSVHARTGKYPDYCSRPHTSSTEAPINPLESDGRGYRCIHCEVRNDITFCHYEEKQIVSLPEHDTAIRNDTRKNDCILAKQQMDEERLEFLDMLYSHCNDGCKNEEGFCGICKVSRVIELMTTRKSESLRAKETTP